MFKTILVPLDGSPIAEGIIPKVRELAHTHDAKVILLRVAFALVFPGADATEAQVKSTEEATGYIENIRRELEAEGIRAEAVVRYGFPAEEILAHSSRGEIDLIAMATHGRTGPVRWMLGSVAEEVVRHSAIPVLLFRVGKSSPREASPDVPLAQTG